MVTFQSKKEFINHVASTVRNNILRTYGTTQGKCIEAADRIASMLIEMGYNAHVQQVWCLYENFESCSDYCYEEHWVTYVLLKGHRLYIDVTMDQFQWAFSKKLPAIYIDYKLPKFYLIKEPNRSILNKCGWTSWYNTGNYENNFVYY